MYVAHDHNRHVPDEAPHEQRGVLFADEWFPVDAPLAPLILGLRRADVRTSWSCWRNEDGETYLQLPSRDGFEWLAALAPDVRWVGVWSFPAYEMEAFWSLLGETDPDGEPEQFRASVCDGRVSWPETTTAEVRAFVPAEYLPDLLRAVEVATEGDDRGQLTAAPTVSTVEVFPSGVIAATHADTERFYAHRLIEMRRSMGFIRAAVRLGRQTGMTGALAGMLSMYPPDWVKAAARME